MEGKRVTRRSGKWYKRRKKEKRKKRESGKRKKDKEQEIEPKCPSERENKWEQRTSSLKESLMPE